MIHNKYLEKPKMEASNTTSPWIQMDLGLWAPLISRSASVSVRKDTVLFHQEDPSTHLYIVQSGRIRITTFQRDGSEKQLYIAERGALFGERSCTMHSQHSTFAVAIVDSQVYVIPYKEAQQMMQTDWTLTCNVMNLMCRKNSILMKNVVELSFADALQRIAQMLINLSEVYGKPHEAGVAIHLRFTHQDVANITNTSRVTVSNTLNLLSSRGVITKKDGFMVLKDVATLQTMADGHYDDSMP